MKLRDDLDSEESSTDFKYRDWKAKDFGKNKRDWNKGLIN